MNSGRRFKRGREEFTLMSEKGDPVLFPDKFGGHELVIRWTLLSIFKRT